MYHICSIDLYDHLIAIKLKENLLVETWREHGPSHDNLPSNCSVQYKVNISNDLQELEFVSSKYKHIKGFTLSSTYVSDVFRMEFF